MAAADNLDRFDLCGIVAWDLMHLNTNAFKVRPNGGGIIGLVDADSIMRHPLDGVRGVATDISLEETLETFVSTQYLEVIFFFRCDISTSNGGSGRLYVRWLKHSILA